MLPDETYGMLHLLTEKEQPVFVPSKWGMH